MSTYSHLRHLNGLFWQILRIGCVATLLSLILWSNTTVIANSQPKPIEVRVNPVTLSVPLPVQQRIDDKQHIILNLQGVEYDPSNVVPYDVYLNLPTGVAPNPESPYYAGTVALFAHPQGATYSLDVTDTVRRLKNINLLKDEKLSVTIIPPNPEQYRTTAEVEGLIPRRPTPTISFQQAKFTFTYY